MEMAVLLSQRSQELIKQYQALSHSDLLGSEPVNASIDYRQLITLLHYEIEPSTDSSLHKQQETEFIQASLRAELLRDLLNSLGGSVSIAPDLQESSWWSTFKFILLALAGTLLAACEGFDGITTMLSVLPLPSFVILMVGLSFSLLSIIVFYSFDLVQVSKNLGVALRDAPVLLDVYLLQMNEIKSIRKKIEAYQLAELTLDELVCLERTIIMLQKRFQSLMEASAQFDNALNGTLLQVVKLLVSSTAGMIFFGSGFFAGQSVAMFLATLAFPVVLPTFWPVIAFSATVGFAAFALYWYVEQAGLRKLVSGWFGLDEDKIEELCDKSNLQKELNKLETLKHKIASTSQLTQRLDILQKKLEDAGLQVNLVVHSADEEDQEDCSLSPKTSANIFSFYRPSKMPAPTNTVDTDEALVVRVS